MRLVLVEWEDSHADGAWHTLNGGVEDRALVCRSVGWLVLDGNRAKVVAPHVNEAEPGVVLQGCGVMTIPTRAVLRIVDLTQPDAPSITSSQSSESVPQALADGRGPA